VPLYRDSKNNELSYEEHVRSELNRWVRILLQRPGLLERTSKAIQTKVNDKVIPEKVHTIITATVKGLVKSVVFGLEYIPNSPVFYGVRLQERDQRAQRLLTKYRKIAAAEGAGTGAGGFTRAVADFPALIVIKMKFSSQEKRPELYNTVLNWEKNLGNWPVEKEALQQVNWEQFQREYRDAIDFRKTFQLIPGLGAIVGAWANYGLVDDLGTVGMNSYRLRILGGGFILTKVTLQDIKADPYVQALIDAGNRHLAAIGFTEHGLRHAGLVSHIASNILEKMEHPERECELAAIAGYLHDIGNAVNRVAHAHSGAILAAGILERHEMIPEEIAIIIGAIGNHDEQDGNPVNVISAALILADKSDVHRSRVRNPDLAKFDIHDRVNYAVKRSFLRVYPKERIALELTIDTKICPVMEYFEIFLARMLLSRKAAEFLLTQFELKINDVKLL